jgi:starch synthase
MMKNLKIAYITPECVPFAKTGGLADVSGALPSELANYSHDVALFMPYYRIVKQKVPKSERLDFIVEYLVGEWDFVADIRKVTDKKNNINYYFIDNEFLYDRDALYVDPATGKDYTDNDDRYIFFCRAVLETLKKLDFQPDIIHAHDWQAALIPAFLKTEFKDDPFFKNTKSVFTIHNMGYQGIFPIEIKNKISEDNSLFNPMGPFEYWSDINLMKAAILYADHITTVSPTYAREIKSAEQYGMGLEGVLAKRSDNLSGILNGVDYKIWSPRKDRLIPHKYFIANLSGKKKNKLELLKRCGFPIRTEQPLIGMISRLDPQKGFDLIEEIIDDIMKLPMQMVLLGTGHENYHQLFMKTGKKYPDRFKPFLEFDNRLAHLIEAGSDMFLMPSRYEPCGLNQLYSLKYGTVPIVRKTGGLADTVINFDEIAKKGNGFVFEDYEPTSLLKTIKRAVGMFSKKRMWYKIVKSGMAEDFSWSASAAKYIELYQSLK